MVGLDSDDSLWDQLETFDAMALLSLADGLPHEYCAPPLHFTSRTRTARSPGKGPFYVVTKGLQLGVYDDWCVVFTLRHGQN